jgi:hypothetical protein
MHISQVWLSQVACKQYYSGDLHSHQADVNGACFMSLKTGAGCDLSGSEVSLLYVWLDTGGMVLA